MSNVQERNELLGLLDALFDERISAEEHARLEARLADDPEASRTYFEYLDLHLALGRAVRETEAPRMPVLAGRVEPERTGKRRFWPGLAAGLAAGLLVAVSVAAWSRGRVTEERRPVVDAGAPRLAQATSARFFGAGGAIRVGAPLAFHEEYALTAGLVELAFREGATAIIRGPAVFEVASARELVMRLGQCSVHAPEGAEGFRVLTPSAQVVDLGTRFFVEVGETGGVDVQVVEGLAEVVAERSQKATAGAVRLGAGEGRRYAVRAAAAAEPIAFDGSKYTARLPDRILGYDASRASGGGVETLRSVTVQRGGKRYSYAVGDLIGFDLVHFRAAGNRSNLTTELSVVDPQEGDGTRRDRAGLLDRDDRLDTGVINPGGARETLKESPVFGDWDDPGRPNTPGMAVRFQRPVVNSEGPDVVFFELQLIVHPERGDPFHVGPLRMAPGLKVHTVRTYDIDLSSPEAQTLAGFRLYEFAKAPRGMTDLLTGRHNGGSEHTVRAKVLAVGIDLSDLGYKTGESAEGLFIQDAMDDQNLVDPVYIGGLPPVETTPASGAAR